MDYEVEDDTVGGKERLEEVDAVGNDRKGG